MLSILSRFLSLSEILLSFFSRLDFQVQKIENRKEKPLLLRPSWYTVLAFSKHCRCDGISKGPFLMESGMLFRVDGR